MSEDTYRQILRDAAADLRERWKQGAPPGDAYGLGFHAGLLNALYSLEGAAEAAGIDPAEVGLEHGWAQLD